MKPGNTITLVLLALLIAVKSLGASVIVGELNLYHDTESRVSRSLPLKGVLLAEKLEFPAESNTEEDEGHSSDAGIHQACSGLSHATSRKSFVSVDIISARAERQLYLLLCDWRL